jgi:sugar phosphate isomerase/epimerase
MCSWSDSPTGGPAQPRAASDRVRADLFEAAPILGVDHIKVGADDDGVPVGYAVLCEGFDRLADDAKSAGVRIAFENTPFTHTSRQPRTRWRS